MPVLNCFCAFFFRLACVDSIVMQFVEFTGIHALPQAFEIFDVFGECPLALASVEVEDSFDDFAVES